MQITGVPSATAPRDLSRLGRTGRMIGEGATRNRVYRPAPAAR